MKKLNLILAFTAFCIVCSPSAAQNTSAAVNYLNHISQQYNDIRKDTWNYTRTVAHSRSVRKIEKNRIALLQTLSKSKYLVKRLPPFEGDNTLRDSVSSFLELHFDVLNNDFEKILDMEAIAEQSYDNMEAYLTAQEMASKKLTAASDRIDEQYKAFADQNSVVLTENNDKLSKKMAVSSEALSYYNKVYLVFFKAYKQEVYLMEAMNDKDINALEQNRNALSSISNEGLLKLKELGYYKGNSSLNNACMRLLTFFQEESDVKMPIVADFMLKSEEYEKMLGLFQAKDRKQVTNDEINAYNKANSEFNREINKFNSINNQLNSRRTNSFKTWNGSVTAFMNQFVPKR